VFVEREWLREQLAKGKSLEAIGRMAGRDASTVSHWVRKHGLSAVHRERHRARGTLSRAKLEALVQEGLSIRQIAVRTERSPTTVRHWLRRYGISTDRAVVLSERAAARRSASEIVRRTCRRHGRTDFVLEARGSYRCLRCRSEWVAERRRRVKRRLMEEAGGRCVLCGYDRYPGALQFHHIDPSTKAFSLGNDGITRSLEKARAEAAKCVLLCSNCHAEIEAGAAELPLSFGRAAAGVSPR
jgi:transposase